MDLSLSEDQRAFRDLARDFLEREAVPHRMQWDHDESVDLAIVPKMAELGFFGLTEPGTGSDAGNLTSRATRDGSDWVIDGQKLFITNGTWADVALVFARTSDDGPRAVGDEEFLAVDHPVRPVAGRA